MLWIVTLDDIFNVKSFLVSYGAILFEKPKITLLHNTEKLYLLTNDDVKWHWRKLFAQDTWCILGNNVSLMYMLNKPSSTINMIFFQVMDVSLFTKIEGFIFEKRSCHMILGKVAHPGYRMGYSFTAPHVSSSQLCSFSKSVLHDIRMNQFPALFVFFDLPYTRTLYSKLWCSIGNSTRHLRFFLPKSSAYQGIYW